MNYLDPFGTATLDQSSSGTGTPPAWQEAMPHAEIISGPNPLVAAANPLLNLVPQLRAMISCPDPARLKLYLVEQIRHFEQRARQQAIAPETIIGARYCVCTMLDETAAQTPWGGSGVWSRQSLLVTFHNETSGGEKFFQLLAKLAQNPQQHKDLLELMYCCIALGFEGRFRVIDNGRSQLEVMKQRLLSILTSARSESSNALSLHWQGEQGKRRGSWMHVPVWVVACCAGLLGLGIYFWFSFSLAQQADNLLVDIGKLRMPALRMERAAAAPAPAAPSPARLAKFLQAEISEGLVTVRDEADRSVVTLRGEGLFEPASAVLMDRYTKVVSRIAQALNQVPGSVLVTGFTDNSMIRTLKFPSNWHLSEARAESVRNLLQAELAAPSRVRSSGRGADEPVAPNDTPANRAKNRRVEITLMVAPGGSSQ